jgi:pimeloyl-ACP methyl ester carboxylesterase
MYVECLDELGVEKTFVIAASASGPAALTFARNHPDRCAGLMFLAAISKPLTLTKLHLNETASLFMQVINSDVASWLLYNTLIRLLPLRARINKVIRERIFEDIDGYHRYLESVREYFPMSAHRAGFDHDRSQLAELSELPLEDIQQPALIIHGADDTTVPVEHGEHMAARMPDATFIRVEPDASHDFFVTHHKEIWEPILEFLKKHTSVDDDDE